MEQKMLNIEQFHHLNYIKKEPLTGSIKGMRYMLRKKTEGEEDFMEGIVWPEPFCYAKTPEEKKIRKRFALSAEGLAEAVEWLNEEYLPYSIGLPAAPAGSVGTVVSDDGS